LNYDPQFLQQHIRSIPDFPKPGIIFRDITTLLKHAEAFRATIQLLVQRYREVQGLHAVCGIESRGFLVGAPLALELGLSFVPIRKPGKLPAAVERVAYDLEYGTDHLEIHQDALEAGATVLIVDDLLATGGTVAATGELLQRLGVTVYEAAFVIELAGLRGRERFSFPTYSLLSYEDD
jgi:adenine phosphoribosyltransferase